MTFIKARLNWRFAPVNISIIKIFSLFNVKQKQIKVCGFSKTIRGLLKFYGNRILLEAFFEILIIHTPFLGLRDGPHKICSRSVQPFDV